MSTARRNALPLALAFVALSACGRKHDPAERPAAQATQAPAEVPADPAAPPPSPDEGDEARTNQALAIAADQAERAPRGADDCESAHNQLLAMLTTVGQELGEEIHRPEREPFLEVCRDMPPETRRCIVPTYAMANQDACATALQALPDDVKQRFDAVINGPGSD